MASSQNPAPAYLRILVPPTNRAAKVMKRHATLLIWVLKQWVVLMKDLWRIECTSQIGRMMRETKGIQLTYLDDYSLQCM